MSSNKMMGLVLLILMISPAHAQIIESDKIFIPAAGVEFCTHDLPKSNSGKVADGWAKWHERLAADAATRFDETTRYRVSRAMFDGISYTGSGNLFCEISYTVHNKTLSQLKITKSSGLASFDTGLLHALKSVDSIVLKFPNSDKRSLSETMIFHRNLDPKATTDLTPNLDPYLASKIYHHPSLDQVDIH